MANVILRLIFSTALFSLLLATGTVHAQLEPSIQLIKQVSVDGGATYFDANDAGSAPDTMVGGDALYVLVVQNNGVIDLSDVVVTDLALGIMYNVGDLNVGVDVVLDSMAIPELDVAVVCDVPGIVNNVASVTGSPGDNMPPVMDSDPANVNCIEPELGCWFTGGQNIRVDQVRGRPRHSGGGVVYPSCSALPGDGGQWTHIDHEQGLQFSADSLTVVECGNVPDAPPGAGSPASTVNYIRATATGTIKGIDGNSLQSAPATAVLVLEDWGEPGRNDKYTLLATGGGAVISLDRAQLSSGGNFQIRQSGCE